MLKWERGKKRLRNQHFVYEVCCVLESRKRRKKSLLFSSRLELLGHTATIFKVNIFLSSLTRYVVLVCRNKAIFFSQFHLSFFLSKKNILLRLFADCPDTYIFLYFDIKSVRRSSISCQSMLSWLYISILTVIWSREAGWSVVLNSSTRTCWVSMGL